MDRNAGRQKRRGRKRGNGEGSVCRRKDGRWVGTLTVGRDANGRLRRRAVYGRTQAEAVEKLGQLRSDLAGGLMVMPDRALLGDYLRRWLEDSVRGSVQRNTHRSYEGIVRNLL